MRRLEPWNGECQDMHRDCAKQGLSRFSGHRLGLEFAAALLLIFSPFSPFLRAAAPVGRWTRPIQLPPLEKEQLVSARLDSAVFSESRSDMGDIRVLDADGALVPYVFQSPKETRQRDVRKSWAAKWTGKPLPTGGLELLLSLHESDPQPEGIELGTSLKDFEQRVRVETSTDGVEWVPDGEHLIFDYSKHFNVRHLTVPIKTDGRRHFRLLIERITSEQESELIELTRRLQGGDEVENVQRVSVARRPFHVNRITFWRSEALQEVTGSQLISYPVQNFSVEQDRTFKRTLVYVGTLREPIAAITIQTPSNNFSRHAEVQYDDGLTDFPNWMMCTEGFLARIDIPPLHREDLRLTFPPRPSSQFRIVIDNFDSPPLEITGVKLEGIVGEVTFLAAPGKTYRLAYGSPKAELPEFDTVAIRESLEAGATPLTATLGDPVVVQDSEAVAEPISLAELFNNPLVAVPVLLLLMAILGWGLYRALRQVDTLPPPKSE